MAVLGRLCLGMVVDPLNPRALLTIIQTDTAPILFVACAVFGLSIGNLITLPPLIIHRKFDAAALLLRLWDCQQQLGCIIPVWPRLAPWLYQSDEACRVL